MITIPLLNSTVQMLGAVNYPNSVSYRKGQTVKDYIKMAGGYAQNARKSKPIVVYMNGMVDTGNGARIEPGCQIIVPAKERNSDALQSVLSVATTSASVATMIATIGNILK